MAGGDDADGNNTEYKNVAIGTSTLGGTRSSDGDAFTAYENVSIGYEAGKCNNCYTKCNDRLSSNDRTHRWW